MQKENRHIAPAPPGQGRFAKLGSGLLAATALAGLVALAVLAPLLGHPSEDAAILFLYSENLAHTGVITYNAGEAPVEGATDFLWMALIAAGVRAGLPAFLTANLLSAAGLFGTALILSLMALPGKPPSLQQRLSACALAMILLMATPPFFAAMQGFSPLFFGFLLAACAFFTIRRNTTALATCALATCLTRPDGVVFALPLTLYDWLRPGGSRSRRFARLFLLTALPGMAYFLWRWRYFGLPMPLPFYVKANFDRFAGVFSLHSLRTNAIFLAAGLPAVLLAARATRNQEPAQRRTFIATLAAFGLLPFLFYSAMNLEQNIAYRFQYPFYLGALLLTAQAWPAIQPKWRILAALAAMILFLSPWYAVEAYRTLTIPAENMPAISRKLAAIRPEGRIATTEAGRLPFYSKWETIDLWGLNTPAFARQLVRPEDVRAFAPDIIVLHALGEEWDFLGADELAVHDTRAWNNMVQNAYYAARLDHYTCWMIPHRLPDKTAGWAGWLAEWRPRLQKKLGYRGSTPVFYAFLLRPAWAAHDAVQDMLLDHGAMSHADYLAFRQAHAEAP